MIIYQWVGFGNVQFPFHNLIKWIKIKISSGFFYIHLTHIDGWWNISWRKYRNKQNGSIRYKISWKWEFSIYSFTLHTYSFLNPFILILLVANFQVIMFENTVAAQKSIHPNHAKTQIVFLNILMTKNVCCRTCKKRSIWCTEYK